MDIIRKIQYLLFCLLAIGFVACDDDDNNSTKQVMKESLLNWQRKWMPQHNSCGVLLL